MPVIAVFDVGKTNKKLFLFDEHYKIVYEKAARFIETKDEDGDSCENLESLKVSVFDSLNEVYKHTEFEIKAINFSTYGASFVYIDEEGNPLTPLYNYLKSYPENLKNRFYETYGGEDELSKLTCSPVLGSLNSGMQVYRLKHEQPEIFEKVKYALHLPQYLSYLLTGAAYSDITSIGCHTNLWNFGKNEYHEWVVKEGIADKFAPLKPSDSVLLATFGGECKVGIGLHDSSAALIPYLVSFKEPFVLISTGTWCITLNPFNLSPLTREELQADCLAYMQYNGNPVKASRLFSGFEHEQQVKRIAEYFNESTAKYQSIDFDQRIITKLNPGFSNSAINEVLLSDSDFGKRNLKDFESDIEAYHQLMFDLIRKQYKSTQLVLTGTAVKRIFVDGGFSKNAIFMNLLAIFFPHIEVFAASVAQATAVGTALAIHKEWNTKPLPTDIIELRHYSAANTH
jgi:sugar (pentulose or hexulose) kinase